MTDFLGNAGSPQLLFLIGFTLFGAAFFATVIFVSFNRRRRKSQMKLGTQPKSAEANRPPAKEAAPEPPPRAPSLPTAAPSSPSDPQSEPALSLDILSRRKDTTPPSPPAAESSPLAARLEYLSSPAPASPEPAELLRLLRHPQTGQLIVEVAGQRYTRLTDVTDKHVGQYILKLVTHLLAFTNGMIDTEAGVRTIYSPTVGQTPPPLGTFPPPTAPGPAPGPLPASPAAQSSPATSPPPAALRPSPPLAPPETPPSRGLLGRSSPSTLLPSLNLANEINKIAQARLLASPLAATTDLEITSDPGGGIRIKVNGVIYASPDDIPNPEVRELIKASIKQWERS
ncbi:MAG: hypothetical protein AB1801_21215 [Chloroflexota bacterium]